MSVKGTPSLDVVKPNTLLIHKTRTKSVARPPSKEFLKTTVLRSASMDLEDDNKIEHKSVKRTSSEKVSNSITTHVRETKQQGTVASTVTNKVIVEDITSMWQNITLKKTTGASKPSIVSDSPPWLKEFRERKTHKTIREKEKSEQPSEQTAKSKDVSNPPRPTIVDDQFILISSEISQSKLGNNIKATTLQRDSEPAIKGDQHREKNVDVDAIKVSVQSIITSKLRNDIETTTTKQQKEITQTHTSDGHVISGSTLTESSQIFKTTENIGMMDSKKHREENINVTPIKMGIQSIETSKSGYNVENATSKQQKQITQMHITDGRVRTDSRDTQKEDGEKTIGSDEKIKNFEVRLKNFQKKIIENVQSLETLINREFEKQTEEFEEIKTILIKKK
ncbi:hypothetical protein FQR65_LT07057 [Abscondita terminalis]|nr:hypothetical protein FQR65_LT07057 [Abscondita terminalis]